MDGNALSLNDAPSLWSLDGITGSFDGSDLAAPVASQKHPDEQLIHAIKGRGHAEPLDIWRRLHRRGHTPHIPPIMDLDLGHVLDPAGLLLDQARLQLEAAKACRRAFERDKRGAHAARALYLCGRWLSARLGGHDHPIQLLRHVPRWYPNSEFGARSAERVAKITSQHTGS